MSALRQKKKRILLDRAYDKQNEKNRPVGGSFRFSFLCIRTAWQGKAVESCGFSVADEVEVVPFFRQLIHRVRYPFLAEARKAENLPQVMPCQALGFVRNGGGQNVEISAAQLFPLPQGAPERGQDKPDRRAEQHGRQNRQRHARRKIGDQPIDPAIRNQNGNRHE